MQRDPSPCAAEDPQNIMECEESLRPQFRSHYGRMAPSLAVRTLEPGVRSLLAEAMLGTEEEAGSLLESLPENVEDRQSALIHLATSLSATGYPRGESLLPIPAVSD